MNNRFLSTLGILIVLLLMLPHSSRGQDLNLQSTHRSLSNTLLVSAGAEYGFVASVGYSRQLEKKDRNFVLFGDITIPWARFDLSDFRARVGLLIPISDQARWKYYLKTAPIVRGLENELSTMINVGLTSGFVGGWYVEKGFVTAEAGFDWAIATHIAHSELYRSTAYLEARNGWYALPGGNIYYGLAGGLSFETVDLVLRIGQGRDAKARSHLLPFYITLGINRRF